MSDHTGIEWTDATWNPIRGCTRVSEGCRNCYAESVAARFSGEGQPYEGLAKMTTAGPRWTGKVAFVEKHLHDPIRWRKPKRVFVNSMSDLFHERVTDGELDRIFGVMALSAAFGRGHTFQILTKRPERMRDYLLNVTVDRIAEACDDDEEQCHIANSLNGVLGHGRNAGWPMRNVWLGTSVENQAAADERIPFLLDTPAAVRFLSCEPLLGPVTLDVPAHSGPIRIDALTGGWAVPRNDGTHHQEPRIHWVIVGGESGRNARPMHPQWARDLRDQCVEASVPYFFKQWGEWSPVGQKVVSFPPKILDGMVHSFGDAPYPDDTTSVRIGKKRAGRDLDGRTWDEMPGGAE